VKGPGKRQGHGDQLNPEDDTVNDDNIVSSRERQRRRPRLAGALAMAASLALLTAACGSGSSGSSGDPSKAGGSTVYQQALAYAQCMRSHGVPNFPDPTSQGNFIDNGSYNLDSGTAKAAENSCKHLLPNGGVTPPGQQQQINNQLLKYAECMRSHGVPNFPDPGNNGLSLKGTGIDPRSPRLQAAQQTCQSLMPSLNGTAGGGS
jgi:hypothetical protein